MTGGIEDEQALRLIDGLANYLAGGPHGCGGGAGWRAGRFADSRPSLVVPPARCVEFVDSAGGGSAQFAGYLCTPCVDRVPVTEVAVCHPQGNDHGPLAEAEPVPIQAPSE
jgi:hypothetical protein